MLLAADQFDRVHQFLRIAIVQQEREALDGFVREPAAAGLFPSQMLVDDIDCVPRARELFAAHRAGRPASDNRYLCHVCVSQRALISAPGAESWLESLSVSGSRG